MRPAESQEPEGTYWFDECKESIERAFFAESNKDLEGFIAQLSPPFRPDKWLVRCLHSIYSREAAQKWWHMPNERKKDEPGALRLVVEIIKGTDTCLWHVAGWPEGFKKPPGNGVNAVVELLSHAHEEFLRAWKDMEACSQ